LHDEFLVAKVSLVVSNSSKSVKTFQILCNSKVDSVAANNSDEAWHAREEVFTLGPSMIVTSDCVQETDGCSNNRFLLIQSSKEQLFLDFSNNDGNGEDDSGGATRETWRREVHNAMACVLLTDACCTRIYKNPSGQTYLSLDNLEYAIDKALHFFATENNANVVFGHELAELIWKLRNAVTVQHDTLPITEEEAQHLLDQAKAFHVLNLDRDVVFLQKAMLESSRNPDHGQIFASTSTSNGASYCRHRDGREWTAVSTPSSQKRQWKSPSPYGSHPPLLTDNSESELESDVGLEEIKIDTAAGFSRPRICGRTHINSSGHSRRPIPYTAPSKSRNSVSGVSLLDHYEAVGSKSIEKHVYHSACASPLARALSGVKAPTSSTVTPHDDKGMINSGLLLKGNKLALDVEDSPQPQGHATLTSQGSEGTSSAPLTPATSDAPSTCVSSPVSSPVVGGDSRHHHVERNMSRFLNVEAGSYDVDEEEISSEVGDSHHDEGSSDHIIATSDTNEGSDFLEEKTNFNQLEDDVSNQVIDEVGLICSAVPPNVVTNNQKDEEAVGEQDSVSVTSSAQSSPSTEVSTTEKLLTEREVVTPSAMDGFVTPPRIKESATPASSLTPQSTDSSQPHIDDQQRLLTSEYGHVGVGTPDAIRDNNDITLNNLAPTSSSPKASLTSEQSKRLKAIMDKISKGGGSVQKSKAKRSIQMHRTADLDQDANSDDVHSSTTSHSSSYSNSPPLPSRSDVHAVSRDANTVLTPPPGSTKQDKKKKKRTETRKVTSSVPVRSLWGIPCLEIKNSSNNSTIEINSEKPVEIETEYFKGQILVMMNTSGELSDYNRYKDHFAGKQRKFEVQIQGQMKTVPEGEIMLGGELSDPMELTFFTKTILKVLTSFARKINPFVHFSFGDEKDKAGGMHELPHLMFPIMKVMDRVIITPPGEVVPTLGSEIEESKAEQTARKASKETFRFELGHTYTFSIYSMYVDFTSWEVCGIPGVGAKSLSYLIGKQIPNLVCYEIEEEKLKKSGGEVVHHHDHKKYLLRMEMRHEVNLSSEEVVAANKTVEVEVDVLVEVEDDEKTDSVSSSQSHRAPITPLQTMVASAAPSPLQLKQAELLLLGQKKNEEYMKKLESKDKLEQVVNKDKEVVGSLHLLPTIEVAEEQNDNVDDLDDEKSGPVSEHIGQHVSKRGIGTKWLLQLILILIALVGTLSLSTILVSDYDGIGEARKMSSTNAMQNPMGFKASELLHIRWGDFDVNPVIHFPRNMKRGLNEFEALIYSQSKVHKEFQKVILSRCEDVLKNGRDYAHECIEEIVVRQLPYWRSIVISQWTHSHEFVEVQWRVMQRECMQLYLELLAFYQDAMLVVNSKSANLEEGSDTSTGSESFASFSSDSIDSSGDVMVPEESTGLVAREGNDPDDRSVHTTRLTDQVTNILSKYSATGGHVIEQLSDAADQVIHGNGEPLRADVEKEWATSAGHPSDDVTLVYTANYDESMYEGDSFQGNRHGYGVFKWTDGRQYAGMWKDNMMHGAGTLVWDGNYRYEGNWQEDHRSGVGTQTYADGMKYDGEFSADQRSGRGVYSWPSGESYSGEWMRDVMHGDGVYTYADGKVYEGSYVDGVQTGVGLYYYPDSDSGPGSGSLEGHDEKAPALRKDDLNAVVNADVASVLEEKGTKIEANALGDHVGDMLAKYSHRVADRVSDAAQQVLHGSGQPLRVDEESET